MKDGVAEKNKFIFYVQIMIAIFGVSFQFSKPEETHFVSPDVNKTPLNNTQVVINTDLLYSRCQKPFWCVPIASHTLFDRHVQYYNVINV